MQKEAELRKETGSTLKGLRREKINGRRKLQMMMRYV